ncbi:TPA: hypothetical protein ACPSKE_000276 [Legionella feeleii]|uniref:Uncharacterized protein n=1 Tax=Legionella feeleii TaxID=453 RepID=A0A0W0TIG3_9GAMM|nr:hypothetical protein [Legionella feeleii]KTC95245.1 hypothetical protein Lfee_2909 [Legionella feeleii]SPX59711.1 Uncharacterised protein [Legionella feeleii]STX38339.1 Uncharacterised protein [Legionella feeleii]
MIKRHNPLDAQKTFGILFIENGALACIKSFFIVLLSWSLRTNAAPVPVSVWILSYFALCAYFTWKPKLTRFLANRKQRKTAKDD